MQTITSDQGTVYEILRNGNIRKKLLQKSSAQVVEINGNKYITEDKNLIKSSQSSGECEHSFDSSLLSNPPIAVCSKCGFQKRGRRTENETCKSCLGKKKLSVYTNQVVSPDFIGDKPYHTGENDIKYVNCSRCEGTGFEPKRESEKQDLGKGEHLLTYKVIDTTDGKHRNDMLYNNGKLYYIRKGNILVLCNDKSRYTIEREISDDVIDKIWEDMPWNMNYWEKDELKKTIKKHLNQKTS